MINWTITNLESDSESGGVSFAYWRAECNETGAFLNGATHFVPQHESGSFVSYADLTEEVILNWVFNIIDKTRYENEVIRRSQQVSQTKTNGLPWAASQAAPDASQATPEE